MEREGERSWSNLMPSLDMSGLAAQKSRVCHRQVLTALSRVDPDSCTLPVSQGRYSHPEAQSEMTHCPCSHL